MAPSSSKLGRGKPLKNQTKEVLHKIYRYFETEIERDPNSTVTAAQLVTHSTGISMNAIKRVLTEYKDKVSVKKEYKSTKRRSKKNITSDDFDAQAIRKIIHGFYNNDEEFPIMKDLYLIMKGDIDYQGSLCTLRRDVAKLGFKWMEKEDNNSILIEKHEIRFARVQYLSRIEHYRAQGRNIVYTGETAIESSRLSSKPKPDGSSTILKQPAKSRLVLLMAGDQSEILRNTLFMYDANKRDLKDESECRRENFEQMENWYKYHLLPVLKPNSIVVVDGGSPFNNRVLNPAPHSNSTKKEMMDYLTARNIPHSPDSYKPQLYQLVLMNKDKFWDYKINSLFMEHGHTVLRIPPYHRELSPIKNILTNVKSYIGKDVCLTAESVLKIAKERVLSLSKEDWKVACRVVEAEENDLKTTDKLIDEISESPFKNVDEQSEESEDENESDSDSD
ncbi:hypothetical protein NE865_03045 [Phthorimaea operculella]|nr:hypothetical protein NE865_03045 [Phthorimaea operculella]